jgi:hypothetical protein
MPRSSKDIIRVDEIADVFSDAAIARLARRAGLPAVTDLKRLAVGTRASAEEYAKQGRQAHPNTAHREIDALARAAARHDYEALAQAYDGMSDATRGLLEGRSQGIQQRAATDAERLSWKLPEAPALRDPCPRHAASETIHNLAVSGGRLATGRKRPGGKQSAEWRRRLHAPDPSRSEPRREAERTFIKWLRADYYTATGRMPPNTAQHYRPGPYARMVAECLRLVRVPTKDPDDDRVGLAVQLINDFDRDRRLAGLIKKWRRIMDPLRHKHIGAAVPGSGARPPARRPRPSPCRAGARPRRQDRRAVMRRQVAVGWVDSRFIPVRPQHAGAQVLRHDLTRHAARKFQRRTCELTHSGGLGVRLASAEE